MIWLSGAVYAFMGMDPRHFGQTRRGTRQPKAKTAMVFPDLSAWRGRLLAIDPSICNCGWAILAATEHGANRVDSGVWHPSLAQDAIGRWAQLAAFIQELCHGIYALDYAVVEEPNRRKIARERRFSRSNQITYGRAVGTVETAIRSAFANEHVFIPDVEAWKGRGSKLATITEVMLRLQHTPQDHNEADALGLGLWFLDACQRADF